MKSIMLLNVLLIGFVSLFAQKSEVFNPSNGAIHGYDPVAYFTENKPVKGNEKITFTWKDATWYFSSKQNMEAFKANPEKYAPQYGGYCAYGLSEGHKAPTDPKAFTIVNDKLYLNYDLDTRDSWSKNKQERIVTADKKWPGIKNKE